MERAELASVIARHDFGPVVGNVARALVLHPGIHLSEIAHRCADPKPSNRAIDDSLAVLINHGIAYAEARSAPSASDQPPEERRGKKTELGDGDTNTPSAKSSRKRRRTSGTGGKSQDVLSYKISLEALLLRTRYARYCHLGLLQHGEEGERIARLLLTRGRMTAADIIKAGYISRGASEGDIAAAERRLIVMVKSGFIRWAGSTDGGPESAGTIRFLDEDDEAAPRKPNGNPLLVEDEDRDWNPDEEMSGAMGEGYDDEMDPSYETHTGQVKVGLGSNARFVRAPLRSNTKDTWLVCTWRLNMTLRNHCCAMVVGALLRGVKSPADAVLPLKAYRAGLNLATRKEDRNVTTSWAESSEVGITDVRDELERGGFQINDVEFQDAVQCLLDLVPAVVRGVPDYAPESLVFLTGGMVSLSRQQTMEDTLRERYSRHGLRVWRALAVHGCMLEKMISDKTMLNIKTVRELLFRLLADGFVGLQEVPKSNEPVRLDRAPSAFYLWRADVGLVYRRILDDALHATRRLMLKIEEVKSTPLPDVVGAERKRKNTLRLLEATVTRCDSLVILFRDFGPIDVDAFVTTYKSEIDLGKFPVAIPPY